MSTPTPFHVAFVRTESNYIKIFLNGIERGSHYYRWTLMLDTSKVFIGYNHGIGTSKQFSSMTIDDYCVIKGKALWSENFTPPSYYLPDDIKNF